MKNVIGRITISGENTIRSKRFGGRMRSKAPGRVKKTGKVMEMASRLFQSIVLQMKDTVDRTIGIVDASGAVVACTDLPRIGEMREEAITELGFAGEIVRFGGYTYHTTGDRASRLEYAVFVQGEDELARSICSLVAVSINNIKTLYDEKHDKATFVKNIILDNILPGDIYIKSRELHFGNDVPRVVFLVRQQAPADVAAIDVVNGMFPDKQKDFVLHISETDIVVVKEVKAGSEIKDLDQAGRLYRGDAAQRAVGQVPDRHRLGILPDEGYRKVLQRRLRPQSRSVRYLTPRRTSSASRIWALAV